ncbi:MAG TPA: hypothetical protein VHR66_32130 [Gemmataceae bacterium]|jgi:hypothetical protein|nr:hypothetical protein [Gemmataceae bacterium]
MSDLFTEVLGWAGLAIGLLAVFLALELLLSKLTDAFAGRQERRVAAGAEFKTG